MSGIFTCSTCQAGLYGRPHTAGLRYVCVKAPGLPGCGTVAVMAAPAEQVARDVILTALDSPEFLAALIAAAAGGTDTAGISRAAPRHRRPPRRAGRGLDRRGHQPQGAFAAMSGTVRQRWETMTTGARRALIQATTAAIPVRPATSRRWNPARVGDPLWRA